MKNTLEVLIVKDEEGQLRPQAGTWKDDVGGQVAADIFLNSKSGQGCTVVKATIIEFDQTEEVEKENVCLQCNQSGHSTCNKD